jgi:hypothetical protein
VPSIGSHDGAFAGMQTLGLLRFNSLTRLNRFNPKACGLSPLCLRFTPAVTDRSSSLDREWAGSALFQSHLQRPVVRHLVAHA